jgi:hypothetical protein
MCHRIIGFTFVVLALVPSSICNAALPRDETWTAKSPDGKVIFVMIPPISLEEEADQGNPDIDKARIIRARYLQSGLYSASDHSYRYWKANFYQHDPAFVSPDGRHVAILGPFAVASHPHVDEYILHFVEDGDIQTSVAYCDISRLWWLKRLIRQEWPSCDDFGIRSNVVWIKTNFFEEIEFDINTGKIISFRDPLGNTIVLSIVMLTAAAIVMLWLVFGRRKKVAKHSENA